MMAASSTDPTSISVARPPTTLAALLTPRTAAAIATLAIRGPRALAIVQPCLSTATGRPLILQAPQACYALWHDHHRKLAPEHVVVLPRNDQHIELHCHGGLAITQCILDQLAHAGCKIVDSEQFMASWAADQSYTNHHLKLDAETRLRSDSESAGSESACSELACSEAAIGRAAESALIGASTLKVAAILLDQLQGALFSEVSDLKAALSCGEHQRAETLRSQLLARAEFGERLVQPWRLTLAGPPNVGKSSLLNALCGLPRALVHQQPGTTRDAIDSQIVIRGWPLTITDTAGVRQTDEVIEREGIRRATARWSTADLGLLVVDATLGWQPEHSNLLEQRGGNLLVLLNKCDLLSPAQHERQSSRVQALLPDTIRLVSTSASATEGLQGLLQQIGDLLDARCPSHGAGVPFTAAQRHYITQLR